MLRRTNYRDSKQAVHDYAVSSSDEISVDLSEVESVSCDHSSVQRTKERKKEESQLRSNNKKKEEVHLNEATELITDEAVKEAEDNLPVIKKNFNIPPLFAAKDEKIFEESENQKSIVLSECVSDRSGRLDLEEMASNSKKMKSERRYSQ